MAEENFVPIVAYFKATPVAQRMAADLGIDLNSIDGSGDHGKITKADVLRASANGETPTPKSGEALQPKPDTWRAPAAKPETKREKVAEAQPKAEAKTAPATKEKLAAPPSAAPDVNVAERVTLKGIKKVIARRMGESVHTTARVTLMTDVDATEFVAVREQLKAKYAGEWGFSPGYNDLLVVIVSNALREFPYMNARFSEDGEAIEYLKPVHMGMAVDTDRGLLVPVIRNSDKKGLQQIGAEFRASVKRARSGKSPPEELSGSTFTITSLGTFRVDAFTPVINLPEAAILGIGRIAEKPVAKDGEVVIRKMMTLSLVFDHRLVDGAPAAAFLDFICDLIEDPAMLFIARR